jgi:two-component system response regulator YesN
MTRQLPNEVSAFFYYERLGKVAKFVRENFAGPIALEDAADVAGLEPKYFSAYFRRKTGTCFRDWLTGVRVDKAKALMQEHDHSITDVALRTGFRDLRTFERAFKAHAGTTPSEYKCSVLPSQNADNGYLPE